MLKTVKARDYLFDNYKAFLMIMVVVGHFIQPCYDNNQFLYVLKYFIYAFHMPAFVFVSGYFSKKDIPWSKALQKMLIPYLAFQVIYCVYYTYGLDINTAWRLSFPKFSLWYLLALFVWKIITPWVRKIPHYFWISLIVSLVFGCFEVKGTYFSVSRILVFYPYFLAGMFFDKNKITELRTRKNRIISILGMSVYVVFAAVFAKPLEFRLSYFYGKESYASLGQGNWEGIWTRLLCYAIGFFFIYALMVLMTEKQIVFSKLGSKTMPVYLFHGLLFKFFEHKTSIIEMVNTLPETVVLLAFCVSLVFVFSLEPFCRFVDLFSNVTFRTFKKEAILSAAATFLQYENSTVYTIRKQPKYKNWNMQDVRAS